MNGGARGPAFAQGSAQAGGERGGTGYVARGGGGAVQADDDASWRTTGSQYIGQQVAIELNDNVFSGTVRASCMCGCVCARACTYAQVCVHVSLSVARGECVRLGQSWSGVVECVRARDTSCG